MEYLGRRASRRGGNRPLRRPAVRPDRRDSVEPPSPLPCSGPGRSGLPADRYAARKAFEVSHVHGTLRGPNSGSQGMAGSRWRSGRGRRATGNRRRAVGSSPKSPPGVAAAADIPAASCHSRRGRRRRRPAAGNRRRGPRAGEPGGRRHVLRPPASQTRLAGISQRRVGGARESRRPGALREPPPNSRDRC